MKATEAVVFLGERLGAERALRPDETDVLVEFIRGSGTKRIKGRAWTVDEDNRLRKAIRKNPSRYAEQIAQELNRSPWSVRKRAQKLRERKR